MSNKEGVGTDSRLSLADSPDDGPGRIKRKHLSLSKPEGEQSLISFLKEVPALVITAVIIAMVIRWLVIQPFFIPSQSMEPTLEPGDRVLVGKFIYRLTKPEPGDVIVFIPPNDTERDYIKRIVAVGGDTVSIKNGQVFVNGKLSKGHFETMPGDNYNSMPQKIPKDHIFVMGDNRPNSQDSRIFGPVPKENILGRAFMVYWPLDRIKILN